MSFIHTADIHIGAFSRTPLRRAPLEAFKTIIDLALSEGEKILVIAGDLFEAPRVGHELTIETVRTLKRAKREGLEIVVTPGSHDLTVKGHGTLALLNEVGLVKTTESVESDFKLKLKPTRAYNFRFYGIPGFKGGREAEYLESRRIEYGDFDNNYDNVLIAHVGLEFGALDLSKISPKYSVIKLSREAQKSVHKHFKYIALGHIHFPVPYNEFFEANIAYPGAPIGRDASDIFETYKLRKMFNTDRRVLHVKLDGKIPKVRALKNSFNLGVDVVEINSPSEAVATVKSRLKDIPEKFKCLIVFTGKVDFEKYSRIRKYVEEEARKYGAWTHIIHSEVSDEYVQLLEEFKADLTNIEAIELEAIRNLIRKYGIKTQPQKILELINVLGKEYTEGVKKTAFDEEVIEEVMKILEEITGR
ncbi:MAG: hypothetical protein B6U75_02150 [Desulfurococcales archaeon ex4484_217_1]|nr:MAG: hypothetical protein B6U75_02150 [Desulfurococcales archaeon ex4484_217_1]